MRHAESVSQNRLHIIDSVFSSFVIAVIAGSFVISIEGYSSNIIFGTNWLFAFIINTSISKQLRKNYISDNEDVENNKELSINVMSLLLTLLAYAFIIRLASTFLLEQTIELVFIDYLELVWGSALLLLYVAIVGFRINLGKFRNKKTIQSKTNLAASIFYILLTGALAFATYYYKNINNNLPIESTINCKTQVVCELEYPRANPYLQEQWRRGIREFAYSFETKDSMQMVEAFYTKSTSSETWQVHNIIEYSLDEKTIQFVNQKEDYVFVHLTTTENTTLIMIEHPFF